MALQPSLLSRSQLAQYEKQTACPEPGEYYPGSRCLHNNHGACRHCKPIRDLLAHIYALELSGTSGSAKASVGFIDVEIMPGDDVKLGTPDDVVVKKPAKKKAAPKKKAPAKKKAAPKKKAPAKKKA